MGGGADAACSTRASSLPGKATGRPSDRTWCRKRTSIIPRSLHLSADLFDDYIRTPETSHRIDALKTYLKTHLHRFIQQYALDLLIVENALTIPVHVPLGLAMTEVIAETSIDDDRASPRLCVGTIALLGERGGGLSARGVPGDAESDPARGDQFLRAEPAGLSHGLEFDGGAECDEV